MTAHARPPLLPGFLLSCDRDKSEKVEISEERQHSQAKKQATKQTKCGAHHSTHVSGHSYSGPESKPGHSHSGPNSAGDSGSPVLPRISSECPKQLRDIKDSRASKQSNSKSTMMNTGSFYSRLHHFFALLE